MVRRPSAKVRIRPYRCPRLSVRTRSNGNGNAKTEFVSGVLKMKWSEAARTEEVRREVHRPINLQDQKRVKRRTGSLLRRPVVRDMVAVKCVEPSSGESRCDGESCDQIETYP
jgi:hypothetical protein